MTRGEPPAGPAGPERQPGEPYVLQCRLCGKVFDSHREHPSCPECDSRDVERVS